MNFFDQQDRARRNTHWLLVLLALAVVALIAATSLSVTLALYFLQGSRLSVDVAHAVNMPFGEYLAHMLRSELTAWVGAGVVLIVVGGSLYKTQQLRGSGRKVAESLGGRPLNPNTDDPAERRILNVVEEMAIASGTPVPLVYVLEESGINAFAAGLDRRSAVIGVTRGCITELNREELQGVIAHEFSHIHFGDMRINLRLVGLLHGILLIGLIGSHMLRSRSYSRHRKNRGAELGIGLVLVVLGYVGVFFGNMIKAAVSRQREYLADASAVQFTRNPPGIAGALKKIAKASDSSYLLSPRAPDYNHFYFSQGVRSRFRNLFATHPPLADRIKRVEPGWDGQLLPVNASSGLQASTSAPKHQPMTGPNGSPTLLATIEQAGLTTATAIATARELIDNIGDRIREAAHEPFTARALIYGLLIDRHDTTQRNNQLSYLHKNAHPATYKAFLQLLPELDTLPPKSRLPVLEMAMPALKLQSHPQYQVFKRNLAGLITLDRTVSLFEWCLYRIVTHCCEEKFVSGSRQLKQLVKEVSIVMSVACQCGQSQMPADPSPLQKFASGFEIEISPEPVSTEKLDDAVEKLAQLRPLEKPKLLKLLAACIAADREVTPEETELFRAIAEALNCPVPLAEMLEQPNQLV